LPTAERPRLRDISAAPNVVSLVRIALVPVALVLLAGGMRGAAVGVLVAMAATDGIDGYVARRIRRVTELGKILDPLADKVAIDSVLALLSARGEFPAWALGVILFRDAAILAGAVTLARRLGSVPQSGRLGKVTFVVLAATTVAYAGDLGALERPLLAGSVTLATVSGALYGRAMAAALRVEARAERNGETS
jgi:CDP-diacylglycerol--glycerol-3-phosphate 3-phosphatidyltransferase